MSLYLTGAQGTGTAGDPRRPKYVENFGVAWAAMDFGQAPVFLVAATLAPAVEDTLTPNADFFKVPVDLDTLLTDPQVTAVNARLEPLGLPADWVNNGFTWRQVIRGVLSIFLFAQRAQVNIAQANLDQTFSQLSAAVRQRLQDAAASLGLSTAGITGATPVRQLMRAVAVQWPRPIKLREYVL